MRNMSRLKSAIVIGLGMVLCLSIAEEIAHAQSLPNYICVHAHAPVPPIPPHPNVCYTQCESSPDCNTPDAPGRAIPGVCSPNETTTCVMWDPDDGTTGVTTQMYTCITVLCPGGVRCVWDTTEGTGTAYTTDCH
jgi:hypothetical protein